MRRLVSILYFLFSVSLLYAQIKVDSFQRSHFEFEINTHYYFSNKMLNQSGYIDVSSLSTINYSLNASYLYFLSSAYYLKARLSYGQVGVNYEADFDFSKFTDNVNALQLPEAPGKQQFNREFVGLVVGTGRKYKWNTNWSGAFEGGIGMYHFLRSRKVKSSFGVFEEVAPNTFYQRIFASVDGELPGGEQKHFENRSYVAPFLSLSTRLYWHPAFLKGRTTSISLGFSCVCLTQEGEGQLDFTYYNIDDEIIGQSAFKSRLLNLSLGFGLSF